MTEYDLAVREVEVMKESLIISMNFFILVIALSKLNKNKEKGCYAPVELSGILCIIPEIIIALVLVVPLIGVYVVWGMSTSGFVANGVYLYTLWIFRKKILKISNDFLH